MVFMRAVAVRKAKLEEIARGLRMLVPTAGNSRPVVGATLCGRPISGRRRSASPTCDANLRHLALAGIG